MAPVGTELVGGASPLLSVDEGVIVMMVVVMMVVVMMVLVVVTMVMVVMVVLTQNDDPSWSVPSCLGQLPCGPPCHHLSSVVNVPDSKALELQLTKTTWPL